MFFSTYILDYIIYLAYTEHMEWKVLLHEAFDAEFSKLADDVQDSLVMRVEMLKKHGPHLGRPHVDSLQGSEHSNMKELRFDADNGVWRIAFAFDPERHAVLLVAGDKTRISKKRFYKTLIQKADGRFSDWINRKKRN